MNLMELKTRDDEKSYIRIYRKNLYKMQLLCCCNQLSRIGKKSISLIERSDFKSFREYML